MRSILLCILFVCSYSVFAETKGTAERYGFKEPVVSGKHPDNVVEEGDNKSKPEAASGGAANYFIYLQSPVRVYPSELWLNGSPYAVSIETVTTPVERDNGTIGGGKKKLVPKTA